MRVLVVGDGDALKSALKSTGADVETGDHGPGALQVALSGTLDVIFLDADMRGESDAFSLCAELRRHGIWTPVLMLSSHDAVDDRVRAFDLGADAYLVRPLYLPEVMARVRSLVRRLSGPSTAAGIAQRSST